MNREEVKNFLLEQFKKVPNREVCKVATEDQIERIAKELDFEEVGKFLMNNDSLNLTVAEVPKEMHFEMILYFILMSEYTNNYAHDYEVWNLEDGDTLKFIENARDILELYEDDDIAVEYVDDVLKRIEEINF